MTHTGTTNLTAKSSPDEVESSGRFREDDIRIGYVSGVFGLRGEVRLYLYNRSSDLWKGSTTIHLVDQQGERSEVSVSLRPGAGKRILGRVNDVRTLEAAQALVGREMVIPRDDLPEPEDGAWYHHDLIGTEVRTESGQVLGRLDEIHTAGDTDIWVVRGGGPERYIPVLKEVVLEVKPGRSVVVADGTGSVLE